MRNFILWASYAGFVVLLGTISVVIYGIALGLMLVSTRLLWVLRWVSSDGKLERCEH